MCFSAGASFTASAVLMGAGIIAVRESGFSAKLPFAAIPVFFSIQQFSEGVLWMALQHPAYASWRQPATYFFLIFAQVVWPLLAPLSILMLEKRQPAKKILAALSILGVCLSAFLLYRILAYPVSAAIDCRHIYYTLGFTSNISLPITIAYLVATLLPSFISSARKTNLLGVVIVISLLVSEIFYTKDLISVWCFFAAILSLIVLFILHEMRKEKDLRTGHGAA
jgi:hypothetical protein